MIKVLRIGNRFNLGGPTYNMAYLTKYLGDDYETLLIGGPHEPGEASSAFILDQLDLAPTIIEEMRREINFANDRAAYQAVRKIIQEFQPDIVHTHASKAGAIGRLAASKEGVKGIVHTFHGHVFHSYFGRLKTMFYKNVERYLAKKSAAIIAISQRQKKELTEIHNICPESKVTVVPLGFDLARFAAADQLKGQLRKEWQLGNRPLIGIIGRLTAIKNHEMFFDGVRMAKNSGSDFTAVVVGGGDLEQHLRAYCESIGLSYSCSKDQDNSQVDVVFTSWIRDVERVYADLSISCLTSLNEGTPVSIIESLASGTPVLSTEVGGVADLVEHGTSGLLFPSEDSAAFGLALVQLLSKTDDLQTMAKVGQQRVLTNFSYDRLTRDIRELYSQILRGS